MNTFSSDVGPLRPEFLESKFQEVSQISLAAARYLPESIGPVQSRRRTERLLTSLSQEDACATSFRDGWIAGFVAKNVLELIEAARNSEPDAWQTTIEQGEQPHNDSKSWFSLDGPD